MRFIVRTTSSVTPLVKGYEGPHELVDGCTFRIGDRVWLYRERGAFATITTQTETAPFVVIVMPPSFAKMRAVEVGRDLDLGQTPKDGVYRRPGVLPSSGGGTAVAA